jgi:DNA polymerase
MEPNFSEGAIIYKKNSDLEFLFFISEKGELDIFRWDIEKEGKGHKAAEQAIGKEIGLKVEALPYFSYEKPENNKSAPSLKLFILRAGNYKKIKIPKRYSSYEWLPYKKAIKKADQHMKALLSYAYEYIRRYEEIQEVNKEYMRLSNSKDWKLSRRFVKGEGPVNAKVMVIGQAPGENEDKMLRPFVGRSGKLLDQMLKEAGLRREEIYITSTVQFFPPKNRAPTKEEIEMCKPFLAKQVSIIKPKYIITLGNVASKTVAGIENVDKNHGIAIKKDGITYLITYHPAAALRFKRIKELMQKDLLKFSNIINSKKE